MTLPFMHKSESIIFVTKIGSCFSIDNVVELLLDLLESLTLEVLENTIEKIGHHA